MFVLLGSGNVPPRTDGYVRAEKKSVFGGTSPNSCSLFKAKY